MRNSGHRLLSLHLVGPGCQSWWQVTLLAELFLLALVKKQNKTATTTKKNH